MSLKTSALLLLGLAAGLQANAADKPVETKGSFLVDPVPVAKTPKYLGVCLEVAEDADRSNLWDWLADSGAKMARVIHPDNDLRTPAGKLENFKQIADKAGFEAYRANILACTGRQEVSLSPARGLKSGVRLATPCFSGCLPC